MFKKACRVKSNTQLKASDRKKLKFELCSQFPNLSDEDLNALMPAKTPLSSVKVVTHSGETVTVYSCQKLPLFFEVDRVIYPTVYMLWEFPSIAFTFTTSEFVAQKIMEGADLMLPGVITDGSNLIERNLQRGDKCAVNITSNCAAFAVGSAVMSYNDMRLSGNRGKCVHILHTYGDKLWSLERTVKIPKMATTLKPNDKLQIVDNVCNYIKNVEIVNEIDETHTNFSTEQLVPKELESEKDSMFPVQANTEKSIISMDELLVFSFLKSLVTSVKNVSLPLLANVFYKVHILEACPPGMILDLKDTKHKKLSNFLNEMAETKLIVLESVTKGVLSISSIDYSHPILKEFVLKHPEIKQSKMDSKKQDYFQGPQISEKFTVTSVVLPLFSKFTYKKGDVVTAQDIRKVITQYVRGENLQDPHCKQEVVLDPLLSSILCIHQNHITWEKLVKMITDKVGHCYQVGLPSNQVISAKGKLPLIDLQVAARSGSKKVTLVNNLELYGINLQEFSRECQHGVAASTTINNLPGLKSAQVQVQGNQIHFIGKLLIEQYRIPKRYIRGMEDAAKKQK